MNGCAGKNPGAGIRFARGRGLELLHAPSGEPVWPVPDGEALRQLKEAAGLFDIPLMESPCRHQELHPGDGDIVIGLGSGAGEAARLYAHLTGRSCRYAARLSDLKRAPPPAVVVTFSHLVSADLLSHLYDDPRAEPAPGIICGDDAAGLAMQVLLRSLACAHTPQRAGRATAILPNVDVAVPPADDGGVLGKGTDPVRLIAAMAAGADLLSIASHSDGIDAFLHRQLTLCPHPFPDDAGSSASPRCKITGFCHRHSRSIADAEAQGRLLHPHAIAARIVCWYVCQGVLCPGAAVDPRYGLGRRLIGNPKIGALITSWSFIASSVRGISLITALIAAGTPLGQAVARYNRSQRDVHYGNRLCLFGDPRMRAPTLPAASPPGGASPAAFPTPPMGRQGRRHRGAGAAFLRLCLPAERTLLGEKLAALALRVSDLVQRYERACWCNAPCEGDAARPGPALRAGVLDYFINGGAQVCDWDWLACADPPYRCGRSMRCWICRRRCQTLHCRLRIPAAGCRQVIICPVCGVIRDAPARSGLRLRHEGGDLIISGESPFDPGWAAGLYVKSWHLPDSFGRIWPVDANDAPARACGLPSPLPVGQLRAYVYLIRHAELSVLTCPLRATEERSS